jgi:putative membrane protein
VIGRTSILLSILASAGFASAAVAWPTSAYPTKAPAGDLYEIRSRQIVASSLPNAPVDSLANAIATDRTKSTVNIKATAKSSGLTLKPLLHTAKPRADIAALTKASSGARDQLHIAQQKSADAEALALHQRYAESGDKPAFKTAAGIIGPIVTHPITMLDPMPV